MTKKGKLAYLGFRLSCLLENRRELLRAEGANINQLESIENSIHLLKTEISALKN